VSTTGYHVKYGISGARTVAKGVKVLIVMFISYNIMR